MNPNVGVNQGQYDPTAKQKLWADSGNAGNFQSDAFYRKQDGTMGIKPEFVKSTNPANLGSVDEINAYLNGVQNNNFTANGGSAANTDYAGIADAIRGGQAPAQFNRADTLTQLRDQYGVGNLEGQMSELDKQEQELLAQTRQRSQNEQGKQISMGVMGGRISEIDRQANEQLDKIRRDKSYLSAQIQTKNGVIDQIMKAKGEDYATASARYDQNLSQNIQIANYLRGVKQDAMTEADKRQDDARAVVTTVYNQITSGGLDPRNLSPAMKAQLAKMEMQAGYPVGLTQNIYDKNPKADIVYSAKNTETDGNDYVQMILKDKETGQMKLEKILLGKSAAYEKQQAELKVKEQNAATAAVKAAKYKGGGSGGGKKATTATAANKAAVAMKNKVDTMVGSMRQKVSDGTYDLDQAHNEVYQKYGAQMKDLGLDDAAVKKYINDQLRK